MQETLQERIKDREIDDILSHHASTAMGFMVNRISSLHLEIDREICVKEIERRLSDTVTRE